MIDPRYAANRLGSMGRFGDSMMMHVNPRELRGLAAMSPTGRLTTNPHTGMPEAFNLLGSLGSLAGGFLGTLIAPGIGTGIGAGLGSLGGQALSGKGVNFGEGLLSGILSYGLGSALSGLAGGAAGAGAGLLGEAAAGAGADLPAIAASTAAPDIVGEGLGSASGVLSGAAAPAPAMASAGIGVGAPATAALNAPATGLSNSLQNTADMWTRAGQNVTNPDALWNTFGKGFMKTTLPIVGGAYGLASGMMDELTTPMQAQAQQQQRKTDLGYRPMRYTGMQPTNQWDVDPRGIERNYFQPGGGWSFMKDGGKVQKPPRMTLREAERLAQEYDAWKMQGRQVNTPSPFDREPDREFRFRVGGSIRGPGGGLDDAIPAVIDGMHPARLSSGEWVAPAHVVSALGNGSTEDGVRQLEGMANRVLKRKYGTSNRQPRPIRAGRFLPA